MEALRLQPKSTLSNALKDINSKLKEYILETRPDNPLYENGIYSGMMGIFLYTRYYLFVTGEEIVPTDILTPFSNNIIGSLSNNPPFSNGLAGNLWALRHMSKSGMITLSDQDLQDFDKYLVTSLLQYSSKKMIDNLHGAFGILNYLIDYNAISKDNFSSFLRLLKEQFYNQAQFIYQETRISLDSPEIGINLGLAHGLSGNIIILTKALHKFPKNQDLKKILFDMTKFLLRFEFENHQSGFFPHVYINGDNNKYPVKIGWCYGDSGPAYALYSFGRTINDSGIEQKGLEILQHCARRRGLNECFVVDAGICHGTAGLTQIFHRMYKNSGIPDFKNAGDYWAEETLRLYENEGIKGFSAKRFNGESELQPSLLEGLSGIGLALLSNLGDTRALEWDGSIFLS